MKHSFFLLLLTTGCLLCFFVSCVPCDNCAYKDRGPFVGFQFMPEDTLKIINDEITEISTRIQEIEREIAEGNDTEELRKEIDSLTNVRNEKIEIRDFFNKNNTTITSITALGAQNIIYSDTTIRGKFRLPLDLNDNHTTFYFEYYNYKDTLEVGYETYMTHELQSVNMWASKLKEGKNTFGDRFRKSINSYTGMETSNEITYYVTF